MVCKVPVVLTVQYRQLKTSGCGSSANQNHSSTHLGSAGELLLLDRITREWQRIYSSTIARNAGWMFLGQGLNMFLLGGYFVVLSRLLGVTEYGILAGAAAFVMIFSPYSSLGSGLIFMRYVSTDRARHGLYFGNILLTTGGMAAFLVAGLGLSASHILRPGSTNIVVPLAISECFCSSITGALSQVFQTYEMPRKMIFVSGANNLLRFCTALALWAVNSHATAGQWALANLGVSTALCIGTLILVSKDLGMPRFSFRLPFQRMGEGAAFAVAGSASSIYTDFDKTLLGHYGMNAANGIYSVAFRVVNLATLPAFSIEMAALPRLFQRRVGGFRDVARYGNVLLKRSLIVGLLMTIAVFFSAPLLPLLFGRGFTESIVALRWLALVPLFRSAHLLLGSILTGAGFQHHRTGIQLVVAASNLTLNLWLIPRYGWLGAAWSALATDVLLGVAYWLFIWWRMHLHDEDRGTPMTECYVERVSN
jgi:O-antigen/teichoic acid export membrane protein